MGFDWDMKCVDDLMWTQTKFFVTIENIRDLISEHFSWFILIPDPPFYSSLTLSLLLSTSSSPFLFYSSLFSLYFT